MLSDMIYFVIYMTCSFAAILANELCIIEEKQTTTSPNKSLPNIKMIYCKLQYQQCCENGCCPRKNSPEVNLQMGSNGRMSPFVWFLITLILFGYIYFSARYCYKKLLKKRTRRCNTQPQELNLMLSFNQNQGLERFNFESMNNAHIHVPFMPTTPITPPPAYMTLTPPPTYNVAIHFPVVPKVEVQTEETKT